MFIKDLQELKNKPTEMNDILEGNQQQNNWSKIMDKWPGGLNGGNPCHRQNLAKKNEKKKKRHLWDNIKHTNIHIIGVPEAEVREKGPKKIFEKDNSCKLP